MSAPIQEKFVLTEGLQQLIKRKEDKFTNSEINTVIKIHVRTFFKENKTNSSDVFLPGLGFSIRIKRVDSKTALVGLTKPLSDIN